MSQPPRRRRLEVEDIGDVTVVNFVDRKIVEDQDCQIISQQLFSLVEELGREKLVLNFAGVEFLSSPLLRTLITLNKKLGASGGRLVLCNIDPQICEMFEITELNRLFKIEQCENDDDNLGGVLSKLIRPKPSHGWSIALKPPPPEPE